MSQSADLVWKEIVITQKTYESSIQEIHFNSNIQTISHHRSSYVLKK